MGEVRRESDMGNREFGAHRMERLSPIVHAMIEVSQSKRCPALAGRFSLCDGANARFPARYRLGKPVTAACVADSLGPFKSPGMGKAQVAGAISAGSGLNQLEDHVEQ